MKGKLIVIEGADGSGKTTQCKLLISYLNKQKIPNAYISFPRYESSLWAKMVKRFLFGEFGKSDEVDPYFVSTLYAGDRFSAKDQINKWLAEGKTVVANRYVPSNLAHMSVKFKTQSEKTRYREWLEELEYKENKIPREDLVILLHVPVSVTKKLMDGRDTDIHEEDLKYQEKVVKEYLDLAGKRKNWVKVECTEGGKILDAVDINKKIINILTKKGII